MGNKSEDTKMKTEKETSASTTATNEIDKKLNEALTKIKEAESTAIANIERATPKSQATTTAPITKPPTTTTKLQTTTTKTPEPQEIKLNVETKRGDGTLTFIKLETKPNKKQVKFYYETSDGEAKMTDILNTRLVDKSGEVYYSDSFVGIENIGDIIFDNITDFSDLSTVTLTYAFEGFDPVTVTFDIPGIK